MRSTFGLVAVLVRDRLVRVRPVLEGLVVVVVEGPEDVTALTSVRFRDCRCVHEDRNLKKDRDNHYLRIGRSRVAIKSNQTTLALFSPFWTFLTFLVPDPAFNFMSFITNASALSSQDP